MRYSKFIILPALLFTPLAFAASTAPSSDMDKLSYTLGVRTGENLKMQEIKINTQQFNQGLNDALDKKALSLTDKEMQAILTKFQKQQASKIAALESKMASENLAKSNAFLAENKKDPKVKTLSSGLQYIELSPGKGTSPKIGDEVTVNYRGTLIDGTEFDSSYSRKESTTFPLENLIPGWQEALVLMKPGAKWKIFLPPKLAYGDKGAGNVIEPNSALIFEIELVSVKPKS